jgi:DNA-binding NarL/FixJ family response regulator
MRLITIRKKRTADILSGREIEIAKYLGHGTGYREIAESLFIAPKTVRNHIQTIYEKLDISSRIELALLLSDSDA